jgi:hypothetical protein
MPCSISKGASPSKVACATLKAVAFFDSPIRPSARRARESPLPKAADQSDAIRPYLAYFRQVKQDT